MSLANTAGVSQAIGAARRFEVPRVLAIAVFVSVSWASLPVVAKVADQETRELIEQLVSRNKPLRSRAPLPQKYPPEFDQKENDRVIAIRDSLLANGIAAFPELIEHLDDTRYGYTDGNVTLKVWQICLSIIARQVQVYERFTRTTKELMPPTWLPLKMPVMGDAGFKQLKNAMKNWWNKHQRMNLHDIQAEAVEWAVKHEKQLGFRDKEEESLVLGWLERLQRRLGSSRKPIRVAYDGDFPEDPKLQPDLGYWIQRWGGRADPTAK